jgi:hypothetical protein
MDERDAVNLAEAGRASQENDVVVQLKLVGSSQSGMLLQPSGFFDYRWYVGFCDCN